MKTFADTDGRTWTITLTVDAAKRVKSLLGRNLLLFARWSIASAPRPGPGVRNAPSANGLHTKASPQVQVEQQGRGLREG